ncbi:hormone-sensitive lipase-like [Pollicipes pollicipes]|uniref:hormone-sensitive lipase-like n=1 Tax=Pollicipes pollicipes TaxID=41117 RepID=UPI0018853355|nr:hormone-sensitive lipase-like [Pollicipes pollicipes]XP_037087342.1 hormone-sensitive lipase-like [Pollicipes pollicipes]
MALHLRALVKFIARPGSKLQLSVRMASTESSATSAVAPAAPPAEPPAESPAAPPTKDENRQQSLSAMARACALLFQDDVSEHGQRLAIGLTSLADHYEATATKADKVRRVCRDYDFSEAVPGNGYRSFVDMFDKMVNASHETCLKIRNSNGRRLPSRKDCAKDVEAWCQWMVSIGTMMEHLNTLIGWSEPGSLFPDARHSPIELLKKAEEINQYCFYGRMMGSQYCPSMQAVLLRIACFMCMYSHYFYNSGSTFRRWATASVFFRRILTDPEYRAKRIVNISRYADIDFCKGFWSQQESEFLQMYPEVACPAAAVNITVGLPPEPLVLPRADGAGSVEVPPPTVHIGPDSVHCRLLATRRREGMLGGRASRPAKLAASPCLVVHCHGGGFVAQSSKSHEVYLREWARDLDVPIFSIDYSLAPEAPFPRATDEAFYAYCWAVKNCRLLGSTGERIIVAGDSAGGNLVATVTMQAIKRGVRVPDGQFLVYTPFNTSFTPSAARLLCVMDPVLPLGFLMRCLHAYAGHARSGDAPPAVEPSPEPGDGGGNGEAAATAAAGGQAEVNYTLNPKRRKLGHTLASHDLDTLVANSLTDEFRYFEVDPDPRLSPFFERDEVLACCPATHLLTCHLDPCLDDCVSMARRWRQLGVPVGLTVLDGVCHGFLNFARFSAEAQEGSRRCVELLRQLLLEK